MSCAGDYNIGDIKISHSKNLEGNHELIGLVDISYRFKYINQGKGRRPELKRTKKKMTTS
jgi:hypothetical protein